MPAKRAKIQSRKGGPAGNQRAVSHGIYSRQVLPAEKPVFSRIRNGSIENELKLLRLRLIRLQTQEFKWLVDRETNPDTEVGLELTEIERRVSVSDGERGDGSGGFSGEETKRVRKRPDFDAIALRIIGAIANLEKLRVTVNAETRNEKAALKIRRILKRFRKAELNALEAACLIEEAGLKLPETIAIVLKNTPPLESEKPEEYGFTEEELEARYQESVSAVKQQEEKWLPERAQEVRDLKDELKGAGGVGVEAMIKAAETMDRPEEALGEVVAGEEDE